MRSQSNNRRLLMPSPRARRGSVLLMVVATLALLAIIAISYATLGRADRAASASLVRESRLDDQAAQFADYLATVIGDNTFATYSHRAHGSGADAWMTRRAHWTIPGTDVFMVSSQAAATGGGYPFDPTGSYAGPFTGGGTDPRVSVTPFVATADPELIPASSTLPGTRFALNVLQDTRTWRNISNFAPDGRPVNLVNLRRNFGALPGTTAGRMSADLSVLTAAGTPTTANTDPNIPADWFTNQLAAFRRAFDNLSPSDPNHVLNQWVDADGDGFVDSRWIELVDAYFDDNNPQWVIPNQGRLRMFLGVRCIDLSGKINVNTATDFTRDPGALAVNASGNIRDFYPAGLSPSDIDLRRLLALNDHHWLYRTSGTDRGYQDLARPLQAGAPSDYFGYGAARAPDIGKAGYASLLYTVNSGQVLGADVRRAAPSNAPELQFPQNPGDPNPNPLTPRARAIRYDEFGADPFSVRFQVGQTVAYRAPFGMADELELRTFEGINDSEHRSRLEQVVGGREDARFSPLRENRPRDLEMAGRVEASANIPDETLLQTFTDIRRLLTTYSGSRPLVDNSFATIPANSLSTDELRFDAMPIISKLNSTTNGSATKLTQTEIRSIFRAYAAALLPYTDQELFPNAWDRTRGDARALHYGGSAELATRIAAHLTANWLDSIDTERVEANGVNYDDAQRTRLRLDVVDANGTLPNTVPPDQWETARVLTLPAENEHPDPDNTNTGLRGPKHLNIYGIEAQPVIVEAGWYGMYTDTPYRAAVPGDNDYQDNQTPSPIPGNPPTLGPITIKTTADLGNPDFLFEVIAFQLHNPFDRDIILANGGRVRYYLEYSHRFFALVEQNAAGSGVEPEPLVLPAYGTRVFYVTNILRQRDIATRIINAHSAAPPPPSGGGGPSVGGSIPLDYIQQWARTQFGSRPGMEPVRIPMVHRESLSVAPTINVAFGPTNMQQVDIFGERPVGAGPGGAAQTPINNTPPTSKAQRKVVNLWRVSRPGANAQDFTNDILLDRMRDPDPGADGVLYSTARASLNDEVGGTMAGDDTTSNPNAMVEDNTGFSFTRWAAFRRQTDTAHQRGAMPVWAMERKQNDAYTGNFLSNQADQASPANGVGDRADYDGSIAERRERLLELVTDQRTGTIVNIQIEREAKDKTNHQVGNNRSGLGMNQVAIRFHQSGNDTNPQLFSRVGDFLLPLGIGPSQNPHPDLNAPTRVETLENQWMTLPEALALAADYYTPPATDPLHLLGYRNAATNPPVSPRLDRGNLVLDDFIPFFDANNNGVFNLNTDEPLGAGIPLALNVLDIFETSERPEISSANAPPVRHSHGGLRKLAQGQVNLNTVTRAGMMTLPMLAPSRDTDPLNWLTDPSLGNGTPLFNIGGNEKWDIASTLIAYRDKSIQWTRPFDNGGTSDIISFRDDADNNVNINGRTFATRLDGIRETPGFRSRGEILAANLRNFQRIIDRPEYSMFRLAPALGGGSAASTKHRGLASTLVPVASGTGFETDDVGNDYAEQLSIANAVLNSVSVRSDVFCVWFVVHGYLPSDVENLGPNDPMIPSIARRYVMVVDRSNVAVRGDKPRIVMFQEVPLK